jgi:hypothetical protein
MWDSKNRILITYFGNPVPPFILRRLQSLDSKNVPLVILCRQEVALHFKNFTQATEFVYYRLGGIAFTFMRVFVKAVFKIFRWLALWKFIGGCSFRVKLT